MNFDFHMHSNASDGSYSPGDLVKLAADSGVTTMAWKEGIRLTVNLYKRLSPVLIEQNHDIVQNIL